MLALSLVQIAGSLLIFCLFVCLFLFLFVCLFLLVKVQIKNSRNCSLTVSEIRRAFGMGTSSVGGCGPPCAPQNEVIEFENLKLESASYTKFSCFLAPKCYIC